MSTADFHAFRDQMMRSPELQRELQRQRDIATFTDTVVSAGADRGFTFTAAEVRQAISDTKVSWNHHRLA